MDGQPSVTFWGQYLRVLSPDSLVPMQGGGGRAQMDWLVAEDLAVGVDFGQAAFSGSGAQFGSFGAVVRYNLPPSDDLNLYVQGGLGYDLLRASAQTPLGGAFRASAVLGDTYILNRSWAVDLGVGLSVLDGPPSPITVLDVRLGLNYRFGRQRYRNLHQQPTEPVSMGVQPDPVTLVQPLDKLIGVRSVLTVKRGDSLWRIAQRPNVLGNGWLWPLLYKTNADKISQPSHIEPGLELKVRQHYTDEETRLALEGAWNEKKLPALLKERP